MWCRAAPRAGASLATCRSQLHVPAATRPRAHPGAPLHAVIISAHQPSASAARMTFAIGLRTGMERAGWGAGRADVACGREVSTAGSKPTCGQHTTGHGPAAWDEPAHALTGAQHTHSRVRRRTLAWSADGRGTGRRSQTTLATDLQLLGQARAGSRWHPCGVNSCSPPGTPGRVDRKSKLTFSTAQTTADMTSAPIHLRRRTADCVQGWSGAGLRAA